MGIQLGHFEGETYGKEIKANAADNVTRHGYTGTLLSRRLSYDKMSSDCNLVACCSPVVLTYTHFYWGKMVFKKNRINTLKIQI